MVRSGPFCSDPVLTTSYTIEIIKSYNVIQYRYVVSTFYKFVLNKNLNNFTGQSGSAALINECVYGEKNPKTILISMNKIIPIFFFTVYYSCITSVLSLIWHQPVSYGAKQIFLPNSKSPF